MLDILEIQPLSLHDMRMYIISEELVKRNVTGPDGFICKPLALRMHPDGLEAPTYSSVDCVFPLEDYLR